MEEVLGTWWTQAVPFIFLGIVFFLFIARQYFRYMKRINNALPETESDSEDLGLAIIPMKTAKAPAPAPICFIGGKKYQNGRRLLPAKYPRPNWKKILRRWKNSIF